MPPTPIDPDKGPTYALEGRVVTMNAAFEVLARGVVYVSKGAIAAVLPAGAPRPVGFETAPLLATGATLYPGLIDLHNHLPYDVIPLWAVPGLFTNRDKWTEPAEYRRDVTGPMKVLGTTPGLMEAVVRYVEGKCLLGGTTTSQGITLSSNMGSRRYYRGVVRNVEQTGEAALAEARTHVADVEAEDAAKFVTALERARCMLLHLAEGTDDEARSHFLDLMLPDGTWAIRRSLAGIHATALRRADFDVMAAAGAAIVWSPLSNLLLYGRTTDIAAARAAGVRIAMGPDWSPSGSKNLLGELKVARLVAAEAGGVLSDREIVAMATRAAAEVVGWEACIGSLEAGKRADIVAIAGSKGDPYDHLLRAWEADVALVVVNGHPRCGRPSSMNRLTTPTETLTVGDAVRALDLAQPEADPTVGALTLGEARSRLRRAFSSLRTLAEDLERPRPLAAGRGGERWSILLDHEDHADHACRPRFGPARPAPRVAAPRAVPLSTLLVKGRLDPLTASEDDRFLSALALARNLPDAVKEGLA